MLAFLALSVITLGVYARYRADTVARLPPSTRHVAACILYCLCGYALNIAPYVAVKRSCFIYHYMPALMYAHILVGLVVDAVVPRQWRSTMCKALLLLGVVGYLYYAPWIYAYPLTTEGHERRRWMPRWN